MKILQMFRAAINGIRVALRTEPNIRRFITVGAIVLLATPFVEPTELAILVVVIFSLISAEAMNISIERLCDFVHPDHHTEIGLIKDVAAGSVLILVVMAILVAIIFISPKIFSALP